MTSFEANPFTWKFSFNLPMHYSTLLAWAHGGISPQHWNWPSIGCGNQMWTLKMITVLCSCESLLFVTTICLCCSMAAAAPPILTISFRRVGDSLHGCLFSVSFIEKPCSLMQACQIFPLRPFSSSLLRCSSCSDGKWWGLLLPASWEMCAALTSPLVWGGRVTRLCSRAGKPSLENKHGKRLSVGWHCGMCRLLEVCRALCLEQACQLGVVSDMDNLWS